ncbi:MAG: ABC transporter ATP-binding protein [Pseudolabrys sp.]
MTKSFLAISGVGKAYPSPRGDVVALQNLNLDIGVGEFVSVLGPSGCGKSTLLKCIAGLETATNGEIRVDGKRLDGPPRDLGMVFQRDVLLDWLTIVQNIMVTAHFKRLNLLDIHAKALELLSLFGLDGYEHRHPWELSGGMRQRAAICRALVDDPKLLLMDEPFGALDAMTRDDLNMEMQRIWLRSRKTVVFVTHSISEAVFLSDRVVVMARNPGRIVNDFAINLPRPRALALRAAPEFNDYLTRISDVFTRLGVLKAE